MSKKRLNGCSGIRVEDSCRALGTLGLAFLLASGTLAGSSRGAAVGPKAVVDKPVHDFGVIAPQQVSNHTFVIRNEGDQTLTIDQVIASCKCILPEDVAEGVPPGASADIKVGFKGKPTQDRYVQSVTIATNDPENPRIVLKIVGKIAPDIVVYPDALIMPLLRQGEPAEGRFDLFSSVWNDFEIQSAVCDNPNVQVRYERPSETFLQEVGASAGWQFNVAFQPEQRSDQFEYQVHVTVRPTDPEGDPRTLKVPIVGEVRGRIAVFGRGVDRLGRCVIGAVDPRAGATHKLMVKVMDEQPELKVVRSVVQPPYLEATLESLRDTGKARLYRLVLTVPPGRLDRAYTGPNAGKVRFEFDHPRIDDLELRLEMLPAAPR